MAFIELQGVIYNTDDIVIVHWRDKIWNRFDCKYEDEVCLSLVFRHPVFESFSEATGAREDRDRTFTFKSVEERDAVLCKLKALIGVIPIDAPVSEFI